MLLRQPSQLRHVQPELVALFLHPELGHVLAPCNSSDLVARENVLDVHSDPIATTSAMRCDSMTRATYQGSKCVFMSVREGGRDRQIERVRKSYEMEGRREGEHREEEKEELILDQKKLFSQKQDRDHPLCPRDTNKKDT